LEDQVVGGGEELLGVGAVMHAVAAVVLDHVEEEPGLLDGVGDEGLFRGGGAADGGVTVGVGELPDIGEFPGEGAVGGAEGFG